MAWLAYVPTAISTCMPRQCFTTVTSITSRAKGAIQDLGTCFTVNCQHKVNYPTQPVHRWHVTTVRTCFFAFTRPWTAICTLQKEFSAKLSSTSTCQVPQVLAMRTHICPEDHSSKQTLSSPAVCTGFLQPLNGLLGKPVHHQLPTAMWAATGFRYNYMYMYVHVPPHKTCNRGYQCSSRKLSHIGAARGRQPISRSQSEHWERRCDLPTRDTQLLFGAPLHKCSQSHETVESILSSVTFTHSLYNTIAM